MAHNNVPSRIGTDAPSSSGKKMFLGLFLILCIGLSSAHYADYKEKSVDDRYFSDQHLIVSKTVLTYYDNDDRFSTYDYRHGYSYRASCEYFDKMHDDDFYGDRYGGYGQEKASVWGYRDRDYLGRLDRDWGDGYRNERVRNGGYWDNGYVDLGRKGRYYEYVPYMRDFEERECYLSAPSNKLFYVKC